MTQSPKRTRWGAGAPVLFFAAHFLYVWLRIDPRLLYEGSMLFPPFRTGSAFALRTLGRPGGGAEYLAAAGAQSYYWGWAGALCITAASALLFLLTRAWVRTAGVPRAAPAAYVPPLLVVGAYGAYGQPLVVLCSLSIALAFALVHARLALPAGGAGKGARSLLALVLLGLATYGAAGGSLLVYAALGGLVEAKAGSSRLRGLLCFALVEAIAFAVGILWLDLIMEQAFWRVSALDLEVDGRGRPLLLALTLFFPALLGWLLFRKGDAAAPAPGLADEGEAGGRRGAKPPHREGDAAGGSRSVRPGLVWALAAAAVAGLLTLSFDAEGRRTRRLHYYTAQHQWERALEEARRIPVREYGLDTIHNVYRALYHSGRLLSDLFVYPQGAETFVLCTPESTGTPTFIAKMREARYLDVGEQALEFGLVTESMQEGHEMLAIYGDHASTLRRLARAYIAGRQPDAARVFLRALSRDLVQGRWARETLARLDADPMLDGDPEIREVRTLMFRSDPPYFYSTAEAMCKLLRRENPLNRMAYEYLLADLLVQRRPEAVVEALSDMEEFGYTEMPRLCQEAVVLVQARSGKRDDTAGYRIGPEVYQRFADFSDRVLPLQKAGRDAEAKRAAVADFGDSYFYYYVFGESGVTSQ